ncbi:MAG: FtsX-like permease family protein [Nitrospirae bacterium]|nr:FtsX-like permease family protein [Nitrospirota bacterium]
MFYLKLILKNGLRHRLRTLLTIVGVAVAITAFGLLRTVMTAWYSGVEASAANRLVVRNSISLVFFLPLSYKEKIRQMDGVKTVSHAYWFGGIYIDDKNFIPNFAVEPKSYLELYPELILSPLEKETFIKDRKSAVAGRKVAKKYNWKVGDVITLKGTIFPGEWGFVLKGIYSGRDKSTDETMFLFHWDYLNESLKKSAPLRADKVGFYLIGLSNSDTSAETAAAIDKTFKNSLAETLTETEKAFQQGFVSMTEAIVIAIQIVSFVVIFIIMAVMANTMAMAARERLSEYAVLKTLGFRGLHLTTMIFGESLLISIAGCALGIAATFPAAKVFSDAMGTFLPVFNVSAKTIFLDIAAALSVGSISAILPSYRAVSIQIADGLRRIG